ncbi:hypothetical protein EV361DRAFT_1030110 [Lentinula raphanica]|nr:hypothetical protein EV361DRAFT_1030110 [Lentinula raphanica]
MVHSRPVFIFIALGAASIAGAAPLRLAPSVEPASQEAASCTHFDRNTPESVNPHDCSEIELNVSSGEHYVLDMNSFHSSRDSSGIVPLPPFDSRSSQEHVDADAASVPSVESRAPYPSGPFDSPLGQERVVAVTVNVPGIGSRAPHSAHRFHSPPIQERADADHTASVPGIASHAPHPSDPFHSLLIQDHVDTDDTSALSIESRASRPSGPFHSPSIEERVDDVTASVPSIESHAPYPSAPFHSLAIQKRADADDAASVPGIESRATSTSGPLEVIGSSFSILSSDTSSAPGAHRPFRTRTDTDIAGADDTAPLALHIPVPLQPTCAAALPDQHKDAREQGDTIIGALSIASHVPDCSGPLHHSAVSVAHTLVQERTITDIATLTIESRSPNPAGPPVVSSDHYVSLLPERASAKDVINVINRFTGSYERDIQGITTWMQFVETNSGKLWLEIKEALPQSRPDIHRLGVKIEIISDIILARLGPVSNCIPLQVYEELNLWDNHSCDRYIRRAKTWYIFEHNEIGMLVLRLSTRINREQPPHLPALPTLKDMVYEDFQGLTAYTKAQHRMEAIFTNGAFQFAASLQAARGDMSEFRKQNTECYQRYHYMVQNSPQDVADALRNRMEQILKTWRQD